MAIGQPTHISKVTSLQLLSSCINLQFQLKVKECGIMFGDILYRVDEGSSFKSLTEYMISKSVLIHAPEMFEGKSKDSYFKSSSWEAFLCINS